MAKTCEELVIQELEALRENQSGLLSIIERLKKENEELRNGGDTEFEPHEVKVLMISEPVDAVSIRVADAWDMNNSDSDFEDIGIDDIRALMGTEEGLRGLGGKRTGAWRNEAVSLEFRTFPYTVRYGRNTFALDFYNNGDSVSCYKVLGKSSQLRTNEYFMADRADELEEYGYGMLRKNLEKYLERREQREAEEGE